MPARLRDIPLPALAWTTVGVVGGALALIFFYAPIDADQGITQKIFYIHVPLALTSYACFAWGAWKALQHLRTRAPGADLESYAAIHQGVIFGALTLITGSIWARTSWGIWWTWSSNQLVTFLILFLFYSAYFMLRYSVEPGPARANMCAVYALFGVVLIPVSWLSIRLANDFIHPPSSRATGRRCRPRCSRPSASRWRGCCCWRRRCTGSSWPASGWTRACASCESSSSEMTGRSACPPEFRP